MNLFFKSVLFLCLFNLCALAGAAERIFRNGSFETPIVTNNSNWQLFNENTVEGWMTTDLLGNVEFWRGLNGIVAPDGQQIAELNSTSKANLFQTVCLVNGESIDWSFEHRGRDGTERIRLDFGAQSITTVNTNNAGFQNYSGTTIYTGPTGNYNMTFVSLIPTSGTTGNLIDNVQITQIPFIEFLAATNGSIESNGSDIPRLLISGDVSVASTIEVLVSSSSATDGVDFNHTQTVNIPAGYYDGTVASSIPINLSINNNFELESSENINFTLSAPTGDLEISDADCSGTSQTTNTYTIQDDDAIADIAVTKSDGRADYIPGGTGSYTITITNNGPGDLAAVTLQDTLPDGVTIDTMGSGVTCTATAPSNCNVSTLGSAQINVTADIENGAQVVITIPVSYSDDPADY